jgi:hypothetical protein
MPVQVLRRGGGMMLSIFNLGTRREREGVQQRGKSLIPPGFKTGPSSPLQVTRGIATRILKGILKKLGEGTDLFHLARKRAKWWALLNSDETSGSICGELPD